MTAYIDVWHRTHPITPENHRRFLDYYGEFVVAPPSDYFEVVAGFRYSDGPSNEDFALYRYASMAKIEESMLSFGADERFIRATDALFSEIDIEETRGVAMHTPYAPEERLDQALAESPPAESPSTHRFLRITRTCSGSARPAAFTALARFRDALEKSGRLRLVVGFHYIVGPVMDLVEIWRLEGDALDWTERTNALDPELQTEIAHLAPERERRGIVPTDFSSLR